MNQNERIIQAILKKIKKDYPNDIALFCCYGSYVSNTTYKKSDVDFYFVPKTEKGKKLAQTFIINRIGYDLWNISWDRLEKIASFDESLISIIADAKIIYSNSKNDEERCKKLQSKIETTQRDGFKSDTSEKVIAELNKAKTLFFDITNSNEIGNSRKLAGNIIFTIANVLCLLNHTYLKFGSKRLLEEILNFKIIPQDFKSHFFKIIKAKNNTELLNSSKKLIIETEKLLPKDKFEKPLNIFKGFYEEASSTWNKIEHACNSHDSTLAFLASVLLQNDLNDCFSKIDTKKTGQYNLLKHFNAENIQKYTRFN